MTGARLCHPERVSLLCAPPERFLRNDKTRGFVGCPQDAQGSLCHLPLAVASRFGMIVSNRLANESGDGLGGGSWPKDCINARGLKER